MISRRTFLLGLGSLATASFAGRAQAHALAEGTPLLLDPGKAEKSLHLSAMPNCANGEYTNKWLVSLGPWQQDPLPTPTWREHLRQQGYRFDTPEDLTRLCRERDLPPEDLDEALPKQSMSRVHARHGVHGTQRLCYDFKIIQTKEVCESTTRIIDILNHVGDFVAQDR